MHTIQPGDNTGVIIKEPSEIGAVATLPTLINQSGDWRAFECDGEWQKDMQIDWESEACMSFTASNNIATYLNWLITEGTIEPAQLLFLKNNGYLGADGKVALSPRFLATVDNTSVDGNDFEQVWNAVKEYGLVPDSAWPMPVAAMNANPANAWKLYYATPTAEILSLGKQFLTFFAPDWRWLTTNGEGATQEQYAEWLQISPVHIAVAVCDPWNTAEPIAGCGPGGAHGVQLSRVEVGVVNNILDHYVPFDKQLEANYFLTYAVQGWVTQIPQPEVPTVDAMTTVQNALPQVQQAIAHLDQMPPAQQGPVRNILSQMLADFTKLLGG